MVSGDLYLSVAFIKASDCTVRKLEELSIRLISDKEGIGHLGRFLFERGSQENFIADLILDMPCWELKAIVAQHKCSLG